jgi:hypothetical protein
MAVTDVVLLDHDNRELTRAIAPVWVLSPALEKSWSQPERFPLLNELNPWDDTRFGSQQMGKLIEKWEALREFAVYEDQLQAHHDVAQILKLSRSLPGSAIMFIGD